MIGFDYTDHFEKQFTVDFKSILVRIISCGIGLSGEWERIEVVL